MRVEEQHFGKTEQNLQRPEEEIKIKYVPVHLDIWKYMENYQDLC